MLRKLDLRDRVQAVVLAYRTGLFETEQAAAADDSTQAIRAERDAR